MTIVTPMLRQYQAIKEQYSDCLLFFRLGDFYEMFNDDAKIAAKELSIVLTSRDSGNGNRMPMCGVPYHAANNYIARLIEKGYKVAICEQLEDPKLVKGLVKRDVIRVITPGTMMDENVLEEKSHNYLAACWREKSRGEECGFGLAYVDISTGEFSATELSGPALREKLADELTRIAAAELILPEDLYEDEFFRLRIHGSCVGTLSRCFDERYIRSNAAELMIAHFQVASLESLGLAEKPLAVRAAAMILDFLQQTQKRSLAYIDRIRFYGNSEFMLLDAATRRNLELTATIRTNQRKGTLLWVLDETETAMGGRLLREWVESPLLSAAAINNRLDAVEELCGDTGFCSSLRECLRPLHDIPRLVGRISYGTAGPRDLAALRATLDYLPTLYALLARLHSQLAGLLFDQFDLLADIRDLLDQAIADEPPLSPREGGLIRAGYHTEVDELRSLSHSARQLLLDLEAREREATGIKTLKVGFNKVFGYYIEISRMRAADAPAHYQRKQTLANGERFVTEELKELESRILNAGERLNTLEYALFCEIRDTVAAAAPRIQRTADMIAHIDALQALAYTAVRYNYCRPLIDDGDRILIKEGRHPVVEQIIGAENYIANDTLLDHGNQRMMLITGPNMAGKSTYMRQVALIVLMARIGSFVPADAAQIGYCDRIFTRVGAADDLASGQSTFMVEMNETSNILRHATASSLILLDEIGRGTSTFDGLSIAWAVAEYIINDACAAKTLFATHYHELTALAENFPLIHNYSIAVKERGSKIVFLRRIVEGGADKSYGIQVAQLAGLPHGVIRRAKEILAQLEAEKHIQSKLGQGEQISFAALLPAEQPAEEHPVIKALKELDIDAMTPLDALLLLSKWKKECDD